MKVLIIGCALFLSGCSDGQWAHFRSLATPSHVQCFSGGKVIYDGYSTGIVTSEQKSDGWYFNEKGTNDLVMVTGGCVIRHESR